MPEQAKIQHIPVKVYRTSGRLMVAAPMPGLQPEDIGIEVTADNRLILQGEIRGLLKDIKELVTDEWSVGGYQREMTLPAMVDAEQANVTYGNGVIVVTFLISAKTIPARLTVPRVAPDHGVRVGNVGHRAV
ncbi:Hsp20/alpha crystallin family protein [Ktedonospora formicarum]|uniref:SHSP domain-containing protein n=1 Tax=Ktedonospora formicarum TaxID=2778364 RepID=A0A8J3I2G8_9CHLR|nr:Hsp20/alpha crystallin family protein [Ktedonospora formicarum]GHO45503.1 hypothetical protein KSX_36660 [Ktedonospora formicarum]